MSYLSVPVASLPNYRCPVCAGAVTYGEIRETDPYAREARCQGCDHAFMVYARLSEHGHTLEVSMTPFEAVH